MVKQKSYLKKLVKKSKVNPKQAKGRKLKDKIRNQLN